jgi:hypothetical protein
VRISSRSSSHAERTKVAANGQPVDHDILDACGAGTLAKQVEKSFEGIGAALRLHFHGAIVAVADIALKAQTAGVRLRKISETDPLDIAEDLRLEAAPFRRRRVRRARAGR